MQFYIYIVLVFFFSKIQQQSKTSVIMCTLLHTLVTELSIKNHYNSHILYMYNDMLTKIMK